MNIRGLYKTSLIDFPGRISTVLFLGGCNLRCRYCYNSRIALDSDELPVHSREEVMELLTRRSRVVDGVTVTGGEPTINDDLIPFLEAIRELSLSIKIDTNGLRPDVVLLLLKEGLVDYYALDIKTSPEKFRELTGSDIDFDKIVESLDLIRKYKADYEVRSTCIPGFLEKEDLARIGERTGRVKRYYIQQFMSSVELMDRELENVQSCTMKELEDLKILAESFSDECGIRGI